MNIFKNEDGEFEGLTADYKNANEFKAAIALEFKVTEPIAVNKVAWMKEVDGEWVMSTNLDKEAKQFYVGTVIQPKGKKKSKKKKVVEVEAITAKEDDVFTRPLIIESDEAVDKLVEILKDEPTPVVLGDSLEQVIVDAQFDYVDNDEQYAPAEDDE